MSDKITSNETNTTSNKLIFYSAVSINNFSYYLFILLSKSNILN